MRMSLRAASVVALFLVPFVAAPAMAENEGDGSETYYKDVLPILQENCQTCHREAGLNLSGLLAPMPLMNYEQTRPWARSIARKVETREMPPWFASAPLGVFENERRLTDGEIQTILSWVEAGAPAGDRADAPPAKMFAEQTNDGWSHGTPDFVIQIEEPYTVPDDAYDINVAFRVPLTEANLPEDVVVRGWEIRTGADGSGVHHVCLFARPGEAGPAPVSSAADGAPIPLAGLLSCVAEGAESGMLPEGFGLELKTGQTLEFNMHFNKESGTGTSFESQAEVGFFLADESVEHLVFNDSLGNMGFLDSTQSEGLPHWHGPHPEEGHAGAQLLAPRPSSGHRGQVRGLLPGWSRGTPPRRPDLRPELAADLQVQGAEAAAQGHPDRGRLLVRQHGGPWRASRIRFQPQGRVRSANERRDGAGVHQLRRARRYADDEPGELAGVWLDRTDLRSASARAGALLSLLRH